LPDSSLARAEVAKALEPWIGKLEGRVGPVERTQIGEPGGRRSSILEKAL
jgi:hypothetical protein